MDPMGDSGDAKQNVRPLLLPDSGEATAAAAAYNPVQFLKLCNALAASSTVPMSLSQLSRNDNAFTQLDNPERMKREQLERRPSYRKIYNDLSSSLESLEQSGLAAQTRNNPLVGNRSFEQPKVLQPEESQPEQVSTNSAEMHSTSELKQEPVNILASTTAVAYPKADAPPNISPQQTAPYLSGPGSFEVPNKSPVSHTMMSPGTSSLQMSEAAAAYRLAALQQAATSQGLLQLASPDSQKHSQVGSTVSPSVGGTEDVSRKREMRLQKNREAAKECRRKKKEYVRCLENRVAVLENQNKALIEELKALKELYCQKEAAAAAALSKFETIVS